MRKSPPPFTEEHRRKISILLKGRTPWNKGLKMSEEYKLKIQPSYKKRKNKEYKGKVTKNCKNCGKEMKVFQSEKDRKVVCSLNCRYKTQKGRELSNETRRKLSEAHKGNKNHSWKGGITSRNKMIRGSLEYRLWRETVFRRDNYTCVWCKQRGVKLNADHIKPFAYFPELRFAIDNGRTLCEACHRTTDTFGHNASKKCWSSPKTIAKVKLLLTKG